MKIRLQLSIAILCIFHICVYSEEKSIALKTAIQMGKFDMVRHMLDSGTNGLHLAFPGESNPLNFPELEVPLDLTIWRGLGRMKDNANSPDWIIPRWALHTAAKNDNQQVAIELLTAGFDVNHTDIHGVSPLMAASWHGNYGIAELLLRYGATPDLTDVFDVTALSYAAAGGQLELVNLLIENGENVFQNTRETLETSPYFWAVAADNPAILKRLMEWGIPIPSAGMNNITLLMTSVWLSDYFAVKALLPRVMDIDAVDNAGRSALEWCAAAYERDRQSGKETGRPFFGNRNYPIARILALRTNFQGIRPEVVTSWSGNSAETRQWNAEPPSPYPRIPGDGDMTLYAIFRDEEQEEQ